MILTHRGQVTHICISELTIIVPDNGLSPGQRQAIIWTNARIFSIELSRIDFSEILIKIHEFSFKKMHLKIWSGKCWPFCLGLNVLALFSEFTSLAMEQSYPIKQPWWIWVISSFGSLRADMLFAGKIIHPNCVHFSWDTLYNFNQAFAISLMFYIRH